MKFPLQLNQYTMSGFTVKREDELEVPFLTHLTLVPEHEREVVHMMGLHFKGIEGGLLLEPGKGRAAPPGSGPLKFCSALPATSPEVSPTQNGAEAGSSEVKQ